MSLLKTYGLEITGFGDPLLGQGTRVRFATAPHVITSTTPDLVYADDLLEDLRITRATLRPLDGGSDTSTITALLAPIDRPTDASSREAGAHLSSLLRSYLWARRPRPDALLVDPITSTDTSVDITLRPGGTAPTDGSVIYIGREALWVGTVSGTAPNLTLALSGRGIWGTRPRPHGLDDPAVYVGVAQNPVRVDRRILVYELDYSQDPPVETIRMRGFIRSVRTSHGSKALEIEAHGIMGLLGRRRFGSGRVVGHYDYRRYASHLASRPFAPVLADDPAGRLDDNNDPLKVMPISVADDEYAILVPVRAGPDPEREGWTRFALYTFLDTAPRLDGLVLSNDPADYFDKPFHEIIFCDADNTASLFRDAAGTRTDHPANIIRCHLVSSGRATWPIGGAHTVGGNGSYDWLPRPWGLDVRDDDIDHATFDDVVSRWPSSQLRARGYFLGASDQLPPARDHLQAFAASWGAYLYEGATGQLAIGRLVDPGPDETEHTIDATTDTLATPDPLALTGEAPEQAPPDADPVLGVEIKCAGRGPSGDPGRILTIETLDTSSLGHAGLAADVDELDAPWFGDPYTFELSPDLADALKACLLPRYYLSQSQLPEVDLEVTALHPAPLKPGQWLTLSDVVPFDITGERGIASHRCLVIGADWDLGSGLQRCTIVDWHPVSGASNTVAPSWRIATRSSNTRFTLDQTYFSDDDWALWQDGATYTYRLFTPDGVEKSTQDAAGTINVGLGGQVNLSTSFGGAVTVAVGDIIRLADFDPTSPWYTAQDHTWIGDAQATLGPTPDPAPLWDV